MDVTAMLLQSSHLTLQSLEYTFELGHFKIPTIILNENQALQTNLRMMSRVKHQINKKTV